MPSATQPKRPSDVLRYEEAESLYSRDTITLAAGNDLPLGAVLGKITASGKFTEFAPAASDGSQNAAAVLIVATDASAADVNTVAVTRHAVVARQYLGWKTGATAPQKSAAEASLTALGIVVRDVA